MSAINYKTEAKKVLDSLPDDKIRIAFNLLEHLKGLTSLEELSLYNTQVTDAGVQDLQKALPNCKIVP